MSTKSEVPVSEAQTLCPEDLFEIAPNLASRLVDDPATLSAVTALMERAFFAGRIRERMDRLDRDGVGLYRRNVKSRHKYAVSVLPEWLAA
jgi:hypothetical protein